MKIYCKNKHKNKSVSPAMIYTGISGKYGTRLYTCAVCAGVREFGESRVLSLNNNYGFIKGGVENVFFHLSSLPKHFMPAEGTIIKYELDFLVDGRVQAINIKPVYKKTKWDHCINSVEEALSFYANAYGLSIDTGPFVEDVLNRSKYIKEVGIHLRNQQTREELLTCSFPVNSQYNKMLWIPIKEDQEVEALLIYTGEITPQQRVRNIWKRFRNSAQDNYHLIEEGDCRLRVSHSLSKEGVIDKMPANGSLGFLRRTRKIPFREEWSDMQQIAEGKTVSFLPVISSQGLQARCIADIRE